MTLTQFAQKVAALIKLMSSDKDGEALAAARALVRLIEGRGRDVYAFADFVQARLLERRQQAPQRAAPAWSVPSDAESAQRLAMAVTDGRKAGPAVTSWREYAAHLAPGDVAFLSALTLQPMLPTVADTGPVERIWAKARKAHAAEVKETRAEPQWHVERRRAEVARRG
jgi:hypothetical protein